jgi:transcription termination/antitermination protein NusG
MSDAYEFSATEPRWYALSTRSRHEKQVRDRLAAVGFEILLPLTTSLNQWSDRKVWTQMPLFPGYCFARFALTNRLAVLQTPGVVRIVGSTRPEPISDEDLAAIQRLSESQRHTEPYAYFVEGAWVQVIRGPLAGLRGQLVRKGQHDCLVIRARLIQQAALVHIEMDEVMPVPADCRECPAGLAGAGPSPIPPLL